MFFIYQLDVLEKRFLETLSKQKALASYLLIFSHLKELKMWIHVSSEFSITF